MPYSGPEDKNLPSNVMKMSEHDRSQWVEIFNKSISSGDSEEEAFKKANGVMKKKETYIESWHLWDRQLMQESAQYNPFGASENEGCANCNWFVSPDACVLVCGNISPSGKSKYWTAKKEMEQMPIPVTIVKEEEKSILQKIKELLFPVKNNDEKEISSPQAEAPVQRKLQFIKQKDNRLRFFTVFSNNFEDRQKEIITAEAHKEFVSWCEQTKSYPQLWLWHSGPKSKWGQVDWLDYSEGFICASGLVDEDKEYIAENLEKQNIGVSHGFLGLQLADEPTIIKYRSFEISPLPHENACNEWTNFITNSEEFLMAFTDKRKEWLKNISGLSDEQISGWEKEIDGMSSKLKELGINWKDNETADNTALMQQMTSAMVEMTEKFKAMTEEIQSYKKSFDDRVAEVFQAELSKSPGGFRATESSGNEVKEKDVKELKEKGSDWFGEVLSSSLKI